MVPTGTRYDDNNISPKKPDRDEEKNNLVHLNIISYGWPLEQRESKKELTS